MDENKGYIFERVFVETPFDTDGDGKKDLISVFIKRPLSTERGKRLPALFVANPYLMTCNEDWYLPHDVNREVQVFSQQDINKEDLVYKYGNISQAGLAERITEGKARTALVDEEDFEFEALSELYDHFLKRDYVAVFSGGLGTLGSEGITKTGSEEEVLAFKAVIDWLGGRTRAFTDKEKNIEIEAWWSTGKVAMTGKSYLGTLAIGVAATGVEGLETIIPEAAISNWYDYYRYGGLNLPALGWQGDDLDILAKYCFSRAKDQEDFKKVETAFLRSQEELEVGQDRASGNYNLFWDERNYLNRIDNFRASVFIIHGINDWNVKTNQCYSLFRELEKRDMPRKLMLHQGKHVYIYSLKDSNTLEYLERWLDYYLKGIDTGIEKEAKVLVQSNLRQDKWTKDQTWPLVKNPRVFSGLGQSTKTIIDDLSRTVYRKDEDNLKDWLDELVLSQDQDYRYRLIFKLDIEDFFSDEDLRFSGKAQLSFCAALNQPTAILSAMLVDLGENHRITEEEIKEGEEYSFKLEEKPSKYRVITRGWLNAQNRSSLYSKEEIKPGFFYDYNIDMVPTDYRIKKGHKLVLIIYGIDAEETQRPDTVTEINIKEETINFKCPLVI